MPPRPFPFPLRVGTDICSIARLHQILTPKPKSEVLPLQRFLPKLLTWPERQYFWGRFKSPDYAYQNLSSVTQFLAGRYESEAGRGQVSQLILRQVGSKGSLS